MSPRDTLKRISAPFVQPTPDTTDPAAVQILREAHARLASIMAEVSSISIEDFIARSHVQVRSNPTTVLRWFVATDTLALVSGLFMAWAAAALTHIFLLGRDYFAVDGTAELVSILQYAFLSLGVVIWFWHQGHYSKRAPLWSEMKSVVTTLLSAMILNGFLLFAMKQDSSRLWVMMAWIFAAVSLLTFRGIARALLRKHGKWHVRTLLVGSGSLAEETRAALKTEEGLGYKIVMQIENLSMLLRRVDGSWQALCDRFNADYVVIALDGAALAQADASLADLVRSGIPFSVSPPLRPMPVLGMVPHFFFSRDVILMSPANNLDQPIPQLMKRAIDVTASGLALLALSPVLLAIAYLVKRDGGPVFFADIRVGRNGKAFPCLKFRSMVVDSDTVFKAYLKEHPDKQKEWDLYHKLRDFDPRVTKVGSFLRRWSLDELPQLINVFRGDMSLVGPRPIMFRERNVYSSDLVHYCRVRPGLTGVWQISGRSDVSFERRIQMDGWYVRNWSLWYDVAILLKTVPVILKKTGAY
ncbi:MAG: undecaprenyl-phosphate galactose phosphotransferase WbaP [Bdellovibrionales bacterium]